MSDITIVDYEVAEALALTQLLEIYQQLSGGLRREKKLTIEELRDFLQDNFESLKSIIFDSEAVENIVQFGNNVSAPTAGLDLVLAGTALRTYMLRASSAGDFLLGFLNPSSGGFNIAINADSMPDDSRLYVAGAMRVLGEFRRVGDSGVVVAHRNRTLTNGGGASLFVTIDNGIPQWGTLYAYDTTDPTKFCEYKLYKESESASTIYTLIQNDTLAISAVNALGTILLNDSSNNIRMSVDIYQPQF